MTNLKQKIPNSLFEAIDILLKDLTEDEKAFIKGNESYGLHHTMGMSIRNNWGLWKKDSPIVKDVQNKYGIFGHGDDCSGLIMAGLWAAVRGGNVEQVLKKEAERYKRHWEKSGLDPKTGEENPKFVKGGFKKGEMHILVSGKKGHSLIIDEIEETPKPKQGMNMIYASKDGKK